MEKEKHAKDELHREPASSEAIKRFDAPEEKGAPSAETHEIRLLVGDARQRDVGKGIAGIDQKAMQKLGLSADGGVIEIVGKRATAAIACPACSEDQDKGIITMDGFIRKNAGVAINEYVLVRPGEVKDATNVVLAPTDMRLNVDEDFTNFVKNRLMERTFVEGDTTLVMMLGHAIPFTVTKTHPHGIVRITYETSFQILNEPVQEAKGVSRTIYGDVGGLREEIQRIKEMVELPLRHPEIFQRLGIEPPKGVLLHGPPGCGKTLLARAIANESEANFFSINGPELLSRWLGESEAKLREIFQQAQQNAPSIIFIDHLDAIGTRRQYPVGLSDSLSSHPYSFGLATQLLALMDGLKGRGNVIVIGATDRLDVIDPALRRPGRFDREIEVGLPDEMERCEILKIHVRGIPLAENVDFKKLAEITSGYTGADLVALCKEAVMKALRRCLSEINLEEERIPPSVLEKMKVCMDDFMSAYKEIVPTLMRDVLKADDAKKKNQ